MDSAEVIAHGEHRSHDRVGGPFGADNRPRTDVQRLSAMPFQRFKSETRNQLLKRRGREILQVFFGMERRFALSDASRNPIVRNDPEIPVIRYRNHHETARL